MYIQVYQWQETLSSRTRTDFVEGGIVYEDEYEYRKGWANKYVPLN